MKKLVSSLHNSSFLGRVFHTLDFCLQKELVDCRSVLDLGCGPSSPIKNCKNIKYSVGVEAFGPYLEKSKRQKIHNKYFNKKIEELNFPENSFDAVVLTEVLEHLPEEKGYDILRRSERWAKKKIIVSTPNGFISQKAVDNNPYQKHLSGWDYKRMRALDFNVRGLAGLKFLRQEAQNDTMGSDLVSSIRFKPNFFWFFITSLSQLFIHYLPHLSFELFCVKNKAD